MGCSVTVAPGSVPSDSTTNNVSTDESWSCPHPEIVDGYCIFHAPNDTVSAERQAAAVDALFAGEATDDVAATACVLEGEFQTVAPSTLGGDTAPTTVDLRGATVQGDIDLAEQHVSSDLLLDGVTVSGGIEISESKLSGRFSAREIIVDGPVTGRYAVFKDRVQMQAGEFNGGIHFPQAAFERDVAFTAAQIRGNVGGLPVGTDRRGFQAARFDGNADFAGSTFESTPVFAYAEFAATASFNQAIFEAGLDFSHTTITRGQFGAIVVYDECDFTHCRVTEWIEFAGSTLHDSLICRQSRFLGQLSFAGADIAALYLNHIESSARVRMNDVSISGILSLVDADFTEVVNMRDLTVGAINGDRSTFEDRLTLSIARCSPPQPVSVTFADATLTAGKLTFPVDGSVQLNLTETRLGDVRLSGREEPLDFDPITFSRTQFDGFDFTAPAHRQALRATAYRLHTTSGSATQSPQELESTYNKAKNGAMSIGDNDAASRFFIYEKRARRRSYLSSTEVSSTLLSKFARGRTWPIEIPMDQTLMATLTRFRGIVPSAALTALSQGRRLLSSFSNWLHEITTGYGERPWRPVIVSFVVISLFAVAYRFVWSVGEPRPPSTYEGTAGAVILSAESFTTLVLGGGEVSDPIIRLLAYAEGFIGAFLIALFVFTLTRSVHR